MDRSEIVDRVIEVVSDTMGVDRDELGEDTTFESLQADSLDRIELVTALEDEFELSIDDDALETIATIGDAADAIENAE